MTPEEKTLLIAVSEGLARLLEERFIHRFGLYDNKNELAPFRALIDTVKEQKDASNG